MRRRRGLNVTATNIYKEEKIAQKIQLVIRTSYIIGNEYLLACGWVWAKRDRERWLENVLE
jgi:hypothetical protein